MKFDDDRPLPVRAPRGQYSDVLDAMQVGQSFDMPADWNNSSMKSAMLSRGNKRYARRGRRVWRTA